MRSTVRIRRHALSGYHEVEIKLSGFRHIMQTPEPYVNYEDAKNYALAIARAVPSVTRIVYIAEAKKTKLKPVKTYPAVTRRRRKELDQALIDIRTGPKGGLA